jgi:hypothetical protein
MMRKILLSLATAGAALAVATPAAAQYYPAQPYGGYAPYGYGDYGQVRALHARIDRMERHINRLDRYNAIPNGLAYRLRDEARRLEYRLNSSARYGLNPYEANDIQRRVARLEQRVQYASANRYGRYGNGYNSYNGYGYYDGDGRGRWDGDRDDDDHDNE